jgi:hypothetical protein
MNHTVLPSLEAFEKRLKLPAVYFVFYDYFMRACIGEVKWKRLCLKQEDNGKFVKEGPVVSPMEEAWAWIEMRNNYYAWMLDAKEKFGGNLVTDYDKESETKKKRNINETLVKMEFDLCEEFDSDDEEDEIEEKRIKSVIVRRGDEGYEEAKAETEATMNEVRESLTGHEQYKAILGKIREMDYKESGQERQKKRLKTTKMFREYTQPKAGEEPFQGWSPRTASAIIDLKSEIGILSNTWTLFNNAYKKIVREREDNKGKKTKREREKVPKETVKEVWGLKIQHVEI